MGKPVPVALDSKIDPKRCMGTWYVQYAIPAAAFIEKGAHNGTEQYTFDDKQGSVSVTYTFNEGSFDGPINRSMQRGRVSPKSTNGTIWNVKPIIGPCIFPVWLDYLIIDLDTAAYSYMTASAPGGWWLYVMTREQEVTDATLEPRLEVLRKFGFDCNLLTRMPQKAS